LEQQIAIYGDLILVNLINQTGHEKPMKLAYEDLVHKMGMNRVKYNYFDFHSECSKMRWDRISFLIDHFKDDLLKQQYYFLYTLH
jgi:phosphatidylinositol 4-phosphatase